ncbi:MAG: tRNA pseudouridine(13) synthase TruD [Candidatus Altiarchaeota archaeon]
MARIRPPARDIYIGMAEYVSSTSGIGGTIKGEPGDFMVAEITPEGAVLGFDGDKPGDMSPGAYTHFTLVKENWDTMRALKEVAQRIGVSRDRFQFAGTKDKRAFTAQRVSAYKVPLERLRGVKIKDIVLKDFTYADENLGLGSLKGNRFTIKVRGVKPGAKDLIEATSAQLTSGFPNFYGHQRFGDVRPITHEVGKMMLVGDFEGAVLTYVGKSFEGEGPDTTALRDSLAESRDFQAALENFPTNLGYEKSLLNHLIQYPGDWQGALRTFPGGLQKMFIHAYQSHIFNRALSECIRRGLTVESLPLVGWDVEADDISARILEADGIRRENFKVAGMGELASKGEYRDAYSVAEDFTYSLEGGDATFGFSLGKGSYATVLLREYMKD